MNYEKLYKNALKKIREGLQPLPDGAKISGVTRAFLEEVFPELGESEDERIRKELIDAINGLWVNDALPLPLSVERKDKWIAWLEKQGESYTKKDVDDAYLKGVTNTKNEIEKQYEANYQIRKDIATFIFNYRGDIKDRAKWMDYLGIKVSFVEKQDEQKVSVDDFKAKNWYVSEVDGKIHDMTYNPTDKVEPKFHEGDWIVDNCNNVWQVVEVSNNFYRLKNINEFESLPKIKWVDETFHLWSVKDAKDGDVLYSLDSKQPFIFKHRKPNEQAVVYCGINTYGKFFIGNTKDCVITTDKYIPATKEQRDTLLKAMADAGYTFDFEKKELKLLISNGGDFESNNSKQKPTWSEDDERIVTALMEGFRYHQLFNPRFGEIPNAEIISWIKSLKERLS